MKLQHPLRESAEASVESLCGFQSLSQCEESDFNILLFLVLCGSEKPRALKGQRSMGPLCDQKEMT